MRRLSEINNALGHLPPVSMGAVQGAGEESSPLAAPAGSAKLSKRTMSPAARARIAQAQRQRWAASRRKQPKAATPAAGSGKRTFSPAARRAIAEAARRRWAAAKRAGKNRL